MLRTFDEHSLRPSPSDTSTHDSQSLFDVLTPLVIAEGFTSRHRLPEGRLFSLSLGLVHLRRPVHRETHGPPSQTRLIALFLPFREAGPWPVFRASDETSTKRVSLDVATYPKEVPVIADGNSLEASLIDCSLSIKLAQRLPSSSMRGGEPMHETRKRSVNPRREQKMPVVWHHAVRKKRDVAPSDRGSQYSLERFVVGCALKKCGTFRGSVYHVKKETGRRNAWTSRHRGDLNATQMPFSPGFEVS